MKAKRRICTVITHFALPSGEYRIGINPSLWAMYSSFNTLEFSLYSTKSIANVGTSAIMILLSALAIEVSVSERINLIACGAIDRISILGKRCWGMVGEWRFYYEQVLLFVCRILFFADRLPGLQLKCRYLWLYWCVIALSVFLRRCAIG